MHIIRFFICLISTALPEGGRTLVFNDCVFNLAMLFLFRARKHVVGDQSLFVCGSKYLLRLFL